MFITQFLTIYLDPEVVILLLLDHKCKEAEVTNNPSWAKELRSLVTLHSNKKISLMLIRLEEVRILETICGNLQDLEACSIKMIDNIVMIDNIEMADKIEMADIETIVQINMKKMSSMFQ